MFETFPCPILRIEFERERVWQISAIKPTGLHTLSDPQEDAFAQALDKFSKKLWRKPRARRKFRFDIAMLADANEAMPPSNKRALKQFVDAGEELGIEVDTITQERLHASSPNTTGFSSARRPHSTTTPTALRTRPKRKTWSSSTIRARS